MTGLRTPADPVADRARTTPDRTAVIDADRDSTWTYREYDRRVTQFARGIDALDASVVGICCERRPDVGALVFAAMRTETTLVPLSLRETEAELDAKCSRTDVDVVVCDADRAALAADLTVDRVVGIEPIDRLDGPALAELGGDADAKSKGDEAWTDETWTDGAWNVEAVDDAVDGRPTSRAPPVASAPDHTLFVLFTSGTTGEPKGVRLTPTNLLASATASAYRLGVLPDDRWLCCLPTYHMGGLAPLIRAAVYGTAAVIQRAFDPTETAEVIASHRVTGVSLVPTMLARLLDADWSPPERLRFVLLGGAPASTDLLERGLDASVPVHPTYGMTETASQVATATPDQVVDHPGTVGQPLSGTRVTVVDGDGDPLGPGIEGELVVAGPTVTPGYLDDDHTAAAFGERGLHTGDLGYRDADGRLWVTGRLSNLIVTGGENVDPAEVERTLERHPAVETATVLGVADEEWGERVGALVVPAADRSPAPASIRAHCEAHLAGFKRPRLVAVVSALPRTASGTVDRDAALDLLRSEGVET